MSYDQHLADRIEQLFSSHESYTTRKMFGGLAFFINGHMTMAASGEGGILVRVDPEKYEKLATESDVEMAVMRGRAMRGWLRVSAEKIKTKRNLERWFVYCTDYVGSLPAKQSLS